MAHGLLGSGFSAMQGGNGWSGFLSGALSSGMGNLVSPYLSGLGKVGEHVGGVVLSAGTGAASSAMTGGDPWMGAAIGAIGYATNQAMHNGKKILDAKILSKSYGYLKYKFDNSDITIDATTLDMSGITQKDLVYNAEKNLYVPDFYDLKSTSGAGQMLGKVDLRRGVGDEFYIQPDKYDFDIYNSGFSKCNVATFFAGWGHHFPFGFTPKYLVAHL